MTQLRLEIGTGPWVQAADADPDLRAMYRRHYSRYVYADGREPKQFVGPGAHIVLTTPTVDALFVWRKFIDQCPLGGGVNCAVFRNESPRLSSELVLAAELWAWRKWPGERLYTYVNPKRVRRKRDPGRCFRRAGWSVCGETKKGLLVLEKLAA